MLLPAFYTKFRDCLSIQLCSYILILKSADNPNNQKLINTCKDIAIYKCFHFHLLKIILTVDCIIDNLRNLIKTSTIQIAVHQVIHKCNDITGFIRNKWFPSLRHIRMNTLSRISNKHRNDQFFKCWLRVIISKYHICLLPECRKQIILFKLCQIFVILQAIVCQN